MRAAKSLRRLRGGGPPGGRSHLGPLRGRRRVACVRSPEPKRAVDVHSPWIAVDLAADRVAWARLLRRAHEVALSGRGTPPVLRDVIVRSWARCVEAGVDPDRPAPVVLDAHQTAGRLAAHPLAAVVSTGRGAVGGAAPGTRPLT